MYAASIANASAPFSTVRYRWDRGSDGLEWLSVPDDWWGLLPPDLPARGREFMHLLAARDQGERAGTASRVGVDAVPVFTRFRLDTAAGPLWVQERLEPAGDADVLEGEFWALTEGEAQLAELDGDTSYDLLTGTFTRHRLVHGLRMAVEKALAKSGSGAYLVVDIDNFGLLNHAYGCRAGDGILVALAERLYGLLGAGVLLGRVGDDSFGIVLEGADEDSALALAERMVRSLTEQPLTPDGDSMVTASVGAIVFPAAACSAEEAMARADLAVAGAKASGRNHFELYALSAGQRAVQRRDLAIARRVQEALQDNRLTFAYQPIVNARSHQPEFHECLLRIRTRNDLVIPAGQFVPMVEDLGLIRQIDHWVLEQAVKELRADPYADLAINVSAYTTGDAAWLRLLNTLHRSTPGVMRRLIVEITETAAMRNLEAAQHFVETVRATGARVALDDFGAGTSSFRHLKSLPVDIIKIDGLFTGRLMDNSDNLLFFKALLGLAQGCGFKTVAECAETAQDAMLLASSGVTYLQGYYFAKPELTRLKGSPVLPLGAEPPQPVEPEDIGGLRFAS